MITEDRTTLPALRSARDAIRVAVLQLTVLALGAATVTLVSAPLPVQLVGLAALALIPGSACAHLLLGETRTRPLLADPAIRLPLTVVFGSVTLLAVTFGLNIAGVPIKSTSVALGATALGAALVIGQAVRRSPRHGPGLAAALRRPATRVVAATMVVAAAVTGAIAMQPAKTETYSTLTFADQSWLTDRFQPVTAGSPVRINWILRTFGYVPEPHTTSVEVALDGSPTPKIAVDIVTLTVSTEPGKPTELGGAATFAAPESSGTHRVSISVYPTPTMDGPGRRESLLLTGWLDVTAP